MNNIKTTTPKQGESTQSGTPFSSSLKTQRSPVMQPRVVLMVEEEVENMYAKTPQSVQKELPISGTRDSSTPANSPRQEYILEMRRSEEETLAKCQKVLKKIRAALLKQKNISMDVKNGVSELEELLDVTGDYRRNWKSAERAKESTLRTIAENKVRPSGGNSTETPKMPRGKRSASSPAETRPGKKPMESALQITETRTDGQNTEEHEGEKRGKPKTPRKGNRRNRRQINPKDRYEAVIIKPAEGHSFADVLKNMRENVKPEEAEVAVRSIRKTKTGAILLELGKGGKQDEFRGAIKDALKDSANVRDASPRITVEIRDLDYFTTKEEVLAAIKEAAGPPEGDITVRLTEADSREQRRAFVVLPLINANSLLMTQRVKIGWTVCRIRYREDTKRCYRCFAAGHMQWECQGPDRKGAGVCIRCGEKGHKLKECENSPKCCICSSGGKSRVDHLPGSRSCNADKQQAR